MRQKKEEVMDFKSILCATCTGHKSLTYRILQVLCGTLLTVFLSCANAANFTVNQTFDGADVTPGDGLCATGGGSCTLRAAIMETNALAGADNITIPAGTYTLALGNTGEDAAAEGDLDILDDLTITGADPVTTEINGNAFTYRVFSILERSDNSLPVVAISNLTLTQGLSDDNGALIYNAGKLTLDNITLTDASSDARAMVNVGDFTLMNSLITGNTTGIYSNTGSVTISNSVFSTNIYTGGGRTPTLYGSAFYLEYGTANISNTIFSANETNFNGGAIYQGYFSSLIIDNSQFNGNKSTNVSDLSGGGAIFSRGEIHITNSDFDSNSASVGGAIRLNNNLSATILDSAFTSNVVTTYGGGIYANAVDDFRVKRVFMSDNQATGSAVSSSGNGGAIYVKPDFMPSLKYTFSENVFTNNTAFNVGGGVVLTGGLNSSSIILRNSEISGNTAAFGGGIYSDAANATLENVTITDNTATIDGGGLYRYDGSVAGDKTIELIHATLAANVAPIGKASNIANDSGIVRLNNTILSVSSGNINCNGNISTIGYNLSSDASCGLGVEGDQSNTDPLLGVLTDNGGFTWTMALQAGSPAINAGSAALCASLNPLDQRYYYRGDAACDIGAYEYSSTRAQSGTLAFTATDFSINEIDGVATVTFSRTGGSEGIVSIPVYDTELGTAGTGLPNYDYDAITTTKLEWADGDNSDKTLNIAINDDSVIEIDETILLQFRGSAYLDGGANLGASAATVTIVNDDMPGEARFSSANYTVAEDGAFINVFVERINGNTAVSVDYATSNGTAVAGTDYNATSGTINFAIGETSKTFSVNITDNAISGGNKTINLALSNPLSGLILGAPATAILTIVDDETGGGSSGSGVIAFESALYTTSENDSTVTYTLARTGGTTGVVNVDVTLEDGSALFGADYNASNQSFTVTFQDGESSITGTISIIDDTITELEESLIVRLSNPQGGSTLGFIDSTAIVITDNDSSNSGGAGSSSGSSDGGGGTLNPLLLLGLLFVPAIRRCKRL